MSGYDVESGELFAARSMVAEAADEGHAQVAQLRAAVEELLAAGWQGQAAVAFGQAWRDWAAGAGLVLAGLTEMAEALGITASGYEQNESTVSSDFQRIAS